MNKPKQLYLVDASSLFFRAYYAIPFMETNLDGNKKISTHALYGYLTTTLKILNRFHPECIVYCFDSPTPSFRLDEYKEYKANRGEMPEDLEEQICHIEKATDLLGLPRIKKEKYEADDLIGSLAFWAQKNKLKTTIISTDKDFAQLVNQDVCLFDPVKEKFYDSKAVFEKWKVHPSQIIDYLALVGDASDNIPGVRGIGKKGAEKLLAKYKTLDRLYQSLDVLDSKLSQKLKDSQKEAFISQKLATIVTDLNIYSQIKEIEKTDMKSEEFSKFLEQMNFKSIHKKLFPKSEKKTSTKRKNLSQKSIKNISLDQIDEEIKPYGDAGVYLSENEVQLHLQKKVFKILKPNLKQLGNILCEKRVKWWGYDLKNLWKLTQASNPLAGLDLMVAGHLVTAQTSQSLSYFCESLLNIEFTEEEGMKHLLQLKDRINEKITEMNLNEVLVEIENPLISILYQMDKRGVLLDVSELQKEKKNLESELIKLEEEIFSLVGHPFNIASPQQLNRVLFEELKLKKGKKTKTGGYSTDNTVLQDLKKEHPIANILLKYRELFKLKTTYVDGLLNTVNMKTQRIHTSFNQTMTATGRLSSVHPNLQNIPIRTQRGRMIREVFIAPSSRKLICADYSQIELRVLAHFSQDPGLLKAFKQDEDIHKTTAIELFGSSKVTDEQRRVAKAVNFGIIYGQTAYGLSSLLEISRKEAEDILDKYFKKFPSVKSYTRNVIQEAQKNGFVETLFGRRRYVKEISSRNKNVQKLGERIVINTRIQGTASEIVKKAMIDLNQSVWSSLLAQIHDELLFECSDEDIETEVEEIKKIMEKAVQLKVPIKVDISYAQNWNQAKK